MIGWRKKSWKLWKGVLSFHFRVCLSVCVQTTRHIFWSRNLIFGLSDPWDMRNYHFYTFYWHFSLNSVFHLGGGICYFLRSKGSIFSFLKEFWKYYFGDYWGIQGMRPIILGRGRRQKVAISESPCSLFNSTNMVLEQIMCSYLVDLSQFQKLHHALVNRGCDLVKPVMLENPYVVFHKNGFQFKTIRDIKLKFAQCT